MASLPDHVSPVCNSSHLVSSSELPWEQAICQVDYHQTAGSGTVGYLKRTGSRLLPALRFLRVFQGRGPHWEGDLIWPYHFSAVPK